MDIEALRDFALSLSGVEEGFPFGEDTLVFKAGGKMFLLVSMSSELLQMNVKCDPELALELRAQHDAVLPGYHMNKQHWNTIIIDRRLTRRFIEEQIEHSYQLVTTKKKK